MNIVSLALNDAQHMRLLPLPVSHLTLHYAEARSAKELKFTRSSGRLSSQLGHLSLGATDLVFFTSKAFQITPGYFVYRIRIA